MSDQLLVAYISINYISILVFYLALRVTYEHIFNKYKSILLYVNNIKCNKLC